MAELGLFTPANPVTYFTPAAAVAAAITSDGQGKCPPEGFLPLTADLPAELKGKGFIRARDYTRLHPVHWRTRIEGQICGATVFKDNPWVSETTGYTLEAHPDGRYLLVESPCLVGWGHPEYHVTGLDGAPVCTIVPVIPNPQDPAFPPAQPGLPIGAGGVGFGLPQDPRKPGVTLPVTVGGLNVTDILKLLGGQGGSTVDFSGVLQVLASLVVQGGNIRSSLDNLPDLLGGTLGPGFGTLAQALDSLGPGVGLRLTQALGLHADATTKAAQQTAAALAASIVPVWGPLFAEMVRQGPTLLSQLADQYKAGVDGLIGAMLSLFRDDIEAHAPVTPANVDKVAAAALRAALTAGSIAQLSGMGLELLHPLKNLGVQQAIGVLAEFAGFSEIAKPFFGATLRYGIGIPAEHRAAAHFRSVLPPIETARELAAIGLLDPNKFIERLELAGYPDPYPGVLNDIRFTPPPARFLAQLLDGSEADRPWLARQFRRLGFSPENIDRGVRAAELKTTQPGRSRLVSALLDAYKKGRLEDAELAAGLEGAALSPTHRGYYLRVAALERRGDRMETIATELLLQYRNQVVGPATVKQELTALGFTDDEITVRMTAAELRAGLKHVQDEDKAIEAEIRALKAKGLTLATRQLRAGFLDLARFLSVGQGMGYTRPFLEVVAGTALLQGAPKTTAAEAAIGLGAAEEANARIAELVAQEVQLKRTDRLTALAQLRGLGLPNDLASVLVELAEAIGGPATVGGDYGLPAGGRLGGAFEAIASSVLGGLQGIHSPAGAIVELLTLLGLPGRDRSTFVRLIHDLQDLFRG